MVKRTIIILVVILLGIAFILILTESSFFAQMFAPNPVHICDHCQKTFSGKPHYVCEHTVDLVLCPTCHNDYLVGKWKLGS